MTDAEVPGNDGPKDYKKAWSQVEDRESVLKDKWHKNGQMAWDIYLGDQMDVPFNILFSNTETIVPAVFSKKPLARVSRRYDEARADVPAKIVQRFLTFCMDMNLPSYPSFMTTMEDAVMDAALPGMGIFRVRLVGKLPVLDYVRWDSFVWGFARRWEDITWIAFAHDLTLDDLFEQFPKLTDEQRAEIKMKVGTEDEQVKELKTGESGPSTIRVWERWDKSTGMHHYLCEAVDGCCLLSEKDPLGLEGFFPIPPRLLQFVHATTDLMPRPLYRLYQEQAEELNEVTIRLRKVIKAIKVRGIYASGIDDITAVFNQDDDNILVPSQSAGGVLVSGKGLDSYIWLIPIDKLIIVAKELYEARNHIKQTIYEILGIGDILRGVSKASETLGAQKIKDKWGSVRINRMRERTAEFVRDGLRLLAEVGIKHTPEELWQRITGVDLMPAMQATVMAQQGQPVPPMATWSGVLKMLQDDLTRAYTIDIETNSSVDSEATQEKAELAEFMNSFGQTMGGLKDLMMSSAQGWEMGKTILNGILSKYDLGEEIAPLLMKLPPPPSASGPPPEVQKMMQDAQKRMADAQKLEQQNQQDKMLLDETQSAASQSASSLTQQQKAFDDHIKLKMADIKIAEDQSIIAIDREMLKLGKMEQQVNKLIVDAGLATANAQVDKKVALLEKKGAQQAQQHQQKMAAATKPAPGGK